MFCPNCGMNLAPNTAYCPNCGRPVNAHGNPCPPPPGTTPVPRPPMRKPKDGRVIKWFAFGLSILVLLLFAGAWFSVLTIPDVSDIGSIFDVFEALDVLKNQRSYGYNRFPSACSDLLQVVLSQVSIKEAASFLNTISWINTIGSLLLSISGMLAILGTALYPVALLTKRGDARKLGRIGFTAAIVASLLGLLLPLILRILVSGLLDFSLLVSFTAKPLILLFVAVAGRILLLDSLQPDNPDKGIRDEIDARHLVIGPAVISLVSSITGLIAYNSALAFGSNYLMAFNSADGILTRYAPDLTALALIGGIFLLIFGRKLKRGTGTLIPAIATAVIGFFTVLLFLFRVFYTGNLGVGILAESLVYVKQILVASAIGMLFVPVMCYQTAFWYGRLRWWMHLVIGAVQFGIFLLFQFLAAVLFRAAILLPYVDVITTLLITTFLLLLSLFAGRKRNTAQSPSHTA